MKIVYVSRSIIPSRTANSINVMKMCNAFASLGHEVVLLAPWTKKLEEKDINDIFEYYGVDKNFILKKLYSPNIKYLKKKIYSFRCLLEIKKMNPDLVYGRDDIFSFYLAQLKGFNTIFERHEPFNKNDFEHMIFKKFILNNTRKNKLITISQELKRIYSNQYTLDEDSIKVVPSATELNNDFYTIPSNFERFKEEFNIGYIGSLEKGKGIEIIIPLAKEFPKIIFHIVGGKQKDIEYWKNKSTELNNLIFHGFINPKDTFKFRNLCDILLAPYQLSNRLSTFMSPIKIFEYMASKTSIICSDLEVIKENVDKEYAILVSSDNIDEWINAIELLYSNTEYRYNIAEKAFKYCIANFTYNSRAKKILSFIEQK